MTDLFTTQARQLAGLCSAVLGWRPDEFWAATPAELATIFAALTPEAQAAGDSALITHLQERFPDG
jgi:Phage tail assembly chaperone protein, TAC